MSATDDLAALQRRRVQLQTTIHDAERAARFQNDAVEQAREALVQAERERLNGGDPAGVSRAEKALAKARAAATADVSPERLHGARRALSDADREISEFAQAHYDELRAAHDREATAAAQAIDAALGELVGAYRRRQEVEGRAASLWKLVGMPRPGLTPPSRVEAVVRAAEAAVMAGGERAPVLPQSYLPDQAEVTPPPADDDADYVGAPRLAKGGRFT